MLVVAAPGKVIRLGTVVAGDAGGCTTAAAGLARQGKCSTRSGCLSASCLEVSRIGGSTGSTVDAVFYYASGFET